MTLRERIEWLKNQLPTWKNIDWDADKIRAQLALALTETADDDAERDRKARIGELVEILTTGRHLEIWRGETEADPFAMTLLWNHLEFGAPQVGDSCGDTLLAALQSLKERCG